MMRKLLFLLIAVAVATPAFAQAPVMVDMNQQALLESDDPQLAANKKLVYDFWRIVLRAGNLDRTAEYVSDRYIQHNPSVASGLEPFVRAMGGGNREPGETQATVPDLVTIFAEDDMVIMAFKREFDNPRMPGQMYSTTWFDMFRVENNLIDEHWDYGLINPE